MSIWHKAATNARGMVIVGTGPAGVAAAVSLRESGWDGTITMIGAEPTPPYERPPLSKASITANVLPGPVPLLDEAGRQSLGITLLSARPVVAIDRASRQVLLASGDAISYQALLIATGAKPRLIKGITCGTTRTHALRTYEDALALRQALRRAEHIVIVGAGLIGLEVASSAVAVGVAVTVIEASDRVMARAVPETLALHVADRHRKEGVAFRFGVAVESIEETAQGARSPARRRKSDRLRPRSDGDRRGTKNRTCVAMRTFGRRWHPRRRDAAHVRSLHLRRGRLCVLFPSPLRGTDIAARMLAERGIAGCHGRPQYAGCARALHCGPVVLVTTIRFRAAGRRKSLPKQPLSSSGSCRTGRGWSSGLQATAGSSAPAEWDCSAKLPRTFGSRRCSLNSTRARPRSHWPSRRSAFVLSQPDSVIDFDEPRRRARDLGCAA